MLMLHSWCLERLQMNKVSVCPAIATLCQPAGSQGTVHSVHDSFQACEDLTAILLASSCCSCKAKYSCLSEVCKYEAVKTRWSQKLTGGGSTVVCTFAG